MCFYVKKKVKSPDMCSIQQKKMIKILLGSCYFQTWWEIADCVLNALFEIEFTNVDIINHYLYVQIH